MASRFRIFRRPIDLLPDHATGVVLAACVLHNYLRDDKLYMPDAYADEVDHFGNIVDGQWRKEASEQTNALLRLPRLRSRHLDQSARKRKTMATAVRDLYCRYFVKEGAVSWQRERASLKS